MFSRRGLLASILTACLVSGICADEPTAPSHASEPPQGPWAQRLKCHGESPTTGKPFCLYASSAYNHGAGVSLITTESTAVGTFSALLQSHDPTGQTRPHFKADETPSPDLFYEIVEQPFKGNTLLAQRTIPEAGVVVTSRPALVVDAEFMDLAEGDEDAKMVLTAAVDALPGEYMARVVRLKTYHGLRHWIEDIVKTNAFPLQVRGRKFILLFPEVSVSFDVFLCCPFRALVV
jgi:hypothetical protein